MKPRIIAFYLPQFHPIPENDAWWGKGFTEWTNVGKAKPLFPGHYQPKVPADLGYYDLRLPETREAQAEMAREAGIEGFCYWHYWFGNGKRLLERPFNEVLESGKPDFPFCLAWANESWHEKFWSKDGISSKRLLIEQQYRGVDDYIKHFYTLLPAFKDNRYIKIDGKPIFVIYRPFKFEDVNVFIELWQKLAKDNGLKGIYFIGHTQNFEEYGTVFFNMGFDAINTARHYDIRRHRSFLEKVFHKILRIIFHIPYCYKYSSAKKYFFTESEKQENIFPTIIPNWDHTPRSGKNGYVITDSTPQKFGQVVREAVDTVKGKPQDKRIIFIKSWNEWGEGNYIEPDLKYGKGYLEELKNNLQFK